MSKPETRSKLKMVRDIFSNIFNFQINPKELDENQQKLIEIVYEICKKEEKSNGSPDIYKTLQIRDLIFDIAKFRDSDSKINGLNGNLFSDGKTLLINLVESREYELVKYLIERGVNINSVDNKENTALIVAVRNNNPKMVKILLKNGANIDSKVWDITKEQNCKKEIINLLYKAVTNEVLLKAIDDSDIRVLKLFNENKRLDFQDANGETPLMHAAKNGNLEVVRYLLRVHSDYHIDVGDVKAKTALYIAAESGYKDIVQLLKKNGANIEHALMLAVKFQDIKTVSLLIDCGADVNYKGIFGSNETPLHIAVEKNNQEMVKLLIEKKANVSAANNKGITPLDIAIENNNQEMIGFLKVQGANVDIMGGKEKTSTHIEIKNDNTQPATLINNEADIDIVGGGVSTQPDTTFKKGNQETGELLKENKICTEENNRQSKYVCKELLAKIGAKMEKNQKKKTRLQKILHIFSSIIQKIKSKFGAKSKNISEENVVKSSKNVKQIHSNKSREKENFYLPEMAYPTRLANRGKSKKSSKHI